jgi:hypothetical protein
MRYKHPNYSPELIECLDLAGFLFVGNTIGPLESRANFKGVINGEQRHLLLKYLASLEDIKSTPFKTGAYIKSGERRIKSIRVCGMVFKHRRLVCE